ncbi:hypothetical protein [Acerihabitans arboris]|uniref:Uncharacterized protein n=1 Tax=Acerihabitans arboris TaxID=2691583 RepID=A0A845SPF2_9GAMM|nr:hypothetical protein [Acerihabitans arboris]NDL64814.1 hypothetical protein [Acerihabitans arboris]
MSYYKYTTSTVLGVWDEVERLEAEFKSNCSMFCDLFGGKPVYKYDVTRVSFYGISFDERPYQDPGLWTKGEAKSRYACWPRKKVPAPLKEQSRALFELWLDEMPNGYVDRDLLNKAMGLDWGMLIITGYAMFRHEDAIYLQTDAKPEKGAGASEILGSDFDLARAAVRKAA